MKPTTTAIIITILIFLLLLSTQSPISAVVDNNDSDTQILRIGFDPNLPPYQFYENGEYKGFNIELIKKITIENQIQIVLIPMPLNECLEKFKNKKIDMIMGIRYIKDLDDIMDVSDSLVQSTISIAMLKEKVDKIQNILNVEPLIIAVERDSVEYEFVKNIKKANYNVAFNQESVIELLLMDRADMMIGVRHVVEYLLDKSNLTKKYTISNSYETPVNYYIGVRKEHNEIFNKINSELKRLKINGEYEEIYNKWINDKNIENQKRVEKNLWVMTIVVIAAFCILLIAAYFNIKLKNRVEEKTNELKSTNTELQKKILEIRNSNELKNLICESSPRSIVIFDNEGKITMMNENSLKICECSHPPIGDSVYHYAPINIMLENHIDRVLKYGESYMNKEMEYNTKDKKWIFRYVIYPLNDYEKKTRGAIITIEDITEEKILKEQAAEKEKNRALAQIISGIAHEIRNPLTSIKTYVELLPRKKDNLEFQKQIAKVVPREVERMNTLIENLIDYAKPRVQNTETVQVFDLVESCVILSNPVARKNGIKLKVNVDEHLFIYIDKNKINQVLLNLMLNAIDAISEKKQWHKDNNIIDENYNINIYTEFKNNKVNIIMEDNGIGMTKDELENVFELFYTTKLKGSGIGLSLSRQIVEDNKGNITIESEKYKSTKIIVSFKGDYSDKENFDY